MNKEKKISGRKFSRSLICIIVVLLAFGVYFVRLFQWQVIETDKYKSISEEDSNFYVKIDAARGQIFDCNGEVLAGNKTSYNVVMDALDIEDDRNPAIAKVLEYLKEDGVSWVDKLPIKINEAGEYEFIADRESEIEYLKSSSMLAVQSYATADDCMTLLTERYGVSEYSKQEARDIISVRYYMTKTGFSRSDPFTIAEDVPLETIEKITEHASEMPGIEIEVSTARDYTDVGTIAPHLVGTLGSISEEQYNYYTDNDMLYSTDNLKGYSLTDSVGQSGAEDAFEDILRGTSGKLTVDLDSTGEVLSEEISEAPQEGNSVALTINSTLQQVANESLARNVKYANQATGDCTAGAVVVLDVDTFGVLAASTYPSYDLEKYSTDDDYYNNLLEDENSPHFNRAFDGIYTPGSVFKPLTAITALEEKIITKNFTYTCVGYYDYYEKDNPPTCIDGNIHGTVDIFSAIKYSCNCFFFDVGRQTTVSRMDVYADAFGLGTKTGIEVSEATGIMSSPTEYLGNHGDTWIDGLTIQTAIGQCDSMFSPLQLATYCATIANNGVRLKTHLYSKTLSYDGTEVLDEYVPEVACDSQVSKKTLKTVQEAMSYVSDYGGTAADTFMNYGVKIACKTGTAENTSHQDNTVFICYAPYDDPEIAIAVVLEYGKEGQFSRAVAKDILDAYFFSDEVTFDGLEQKAEEETAVTEDASSAAENSDEAYEEEYYINDTEESEASSVGVVESNNYDVPPIEGLDSAKNYGDEDSEANQDEAEEDEESSDSGGSYSKRGDDIPDISADSG